MYRVHTTQAESNYNKPKLAGVTASYMRFIGSRNSKLPTLFFTYQFNFHQNENSWISNAWDPVTSSYKAYLYESIEFRGEHLIGYGFSVKLSEKFRLLQSTSAGIYHSSLSGEPETDGAPELFSYDFRSYKNVGFVWGVQFSLAYDF